MRLNDVSFSYRERATFGNDGLTALKHVSLEVRPGEKVGLIGPNGAGKSTLLRLMAGILRPNSGTCDARDMSRALLSLTAGFDSDLSGAHNIVMHGMLSGLSRREAVRRIPAVAEMAGLGQAINRRVATYSTGMRARLCFWTAMNLDADVMLVDEVLSVGDLKFRQKSRDAMLDLLASNRAVVIASHNLSFLESLCDRVIWLHDGRIVSDGDNAGVIENYRASLAPPADTGPLTTHGPPRQIFVCGTPRSGTTALAQLLNTNPHIVVGIERYGRLLLRIRDGNQNDLFTKDRFFSYEAGDADVDFNIAHKDLTENSKRKLENAAFVGDKVPRLYRRLRFINDAFANCVVVYIVRNPIQVAASWQRRAERENDRWPTRNGFQEATIEWNESLVFAMQSRQLFRNRLILLSYDRVFGSRRFAVWRELMGRLELPAKPSESTRLFLDNAFRRATSRRELPPDILRYVSRSADYITYARLLGQVL